MTPILVRCAILIAAAAALSAEDAPGGPGGWDMVVSNFEAGGRMMWPLLGLSVVLVAFTIERLVRFSPRRIVPRGFSGEMRGLWNAGRFAEIVARCEQDGSCLARIIRFIVEHRQAPPQMVADHASDIGAREIRPHLAKLTPLAVVATLAPLVGLVGTVLGMKSAFEQFRLLGATGDPGVFAGAIAHMLVATATGLIVAMAGIAVHHLLKSWAVRTSGRLEDEVSELINDWMVPKTATGGPADGR
ncbi:MAG: hypothetical protein RLZZ127_3067 [Planctomycetota bacterium]|jgi:biopolymer transport protein ExbB